MNHQDVKTPRPRSKDTGLYEQSNRGHRVIRLPFEESAYTEIVDDPELFRAYVDDYLTKFAELLPDSMQLSYHLDEIRYSKRQQLYYRRVKVGKLKYTIQPSFITPYWTANCEEVAYPLRLIHQGTSFDLIVEGYGRHADYWYRIFLHIGRFSIVGTTARHQGVAPKHLAADEKISHWCGEEICICTTASEDCLWGAEASQSSDEAGLEQGYSIFKQEAQLLEEGYQPETVNTDGWKATRKAWKNLFESVVLILCFLHGYLKIRSTSKKLACKNELMNLVWEAYEQECKEDFLLKTTELEQWANKNIEHQSTHENVLKLCNKATKYAAYYEQPNAYRTSNMVDRPMKKMNQFLVNKQYFHGHFASAQLLTRAWALCYNFMPFCSRYKYNHPQKAEKFNSRAAQYNQFQYHQNWLINLMTSASLNGFRRVSPQMS
ncbi:MAG: hypothetical protein O4805_22320 [Trichodesmium sp. St16_bin2-tuft]|nr:hypothetical protein [Trichodesmium sp. St16_bin2-tuft]